jgi:hypothetical protein
MTVLLLSLAVAALLIGCLYAVVWLRWRYRLARRRRQRLVERECWRDQLDRDERRLRLGLP